MYSWESEEELAKKLLYKIQTRDKEIKNIPRLEMKNNTLQQRNRNLIEDNMTLIDILKDSNLNKEQLDKLQKIMKRRIYLLQREE